MKFQIKTALWMMGIAAVLFGVGGSVLMERLVQQSLKQEEEDMYGAYEMTAGMLRAVGEINGSLVYRDVAECLNLITDGTELWDAFSLCTKDRVIYFSCRSVKTDCRREAGRESCDSFRGRNRTARRRI